MDRTGGHVTLGPGLLNRGELINLSSRRSALFALLKTLTYIWSVQVNSAHFPIDALSEAQGQRWPSTGCIRLHRAERQKRTAKTLVTARYWPLLYGFLDLLWARLLNSLSVKSRQERAGCTSWRRQPDTHVNCTSQERFLAVYTYSRAGHHLTLANRSCFYKTPG